MTRSLALVPIDLARAAAAEWIDARHEDALTLVGSTAKALAKEAAKSL